MNGPVKSDGSPRGAVGELDFWVAESSGPDPMTLEWQPVEGNWQVVVMLADGRAGVAADVRAAATSPVLSWLAGGLKAVGLLVGVTLDMLAVQKVHTRQNPGSPAGGRS